MTEKELMWARLRNDWAVISHTMGRDLQLRSSRRNFHKHADEYLNTVLDSADPVSATRVVATWLKTYNLPIEPGKMKSYQRFHEMCYDVAIGMNHGGAYPRPN
jgi:hypothetical protein